MSNIGHNNPPTDVELLQQNLQDTNADRVARAHELLSAVDRMPESVDDDATAEKVTAFIKQISIAKKDCEDARKESKEPFLRGGKIVDAFFKQVIDPLDRAKGIAETRLSVFLRKKQQEREEAARKERERLAAERAALEAEAQKLEQEKRAFAAEEASRMAEELKKQETKVEKMARGPVAKVDDASASLRKRWVFEITDMNQIDLDVLRPHFDQVAIEKALRSFVASGGREIKGATIFEEIKTAVR